MSSPLKRPILRHYFTSNILLGVEVRIRSSKRGTIDRIGSANELWSYDLLRIVGKRQIADALIDRLERVV
jgi:hypothetical protein